MRRSCGRSAGNLRSRLQRCLQSLLSGGRSEGSTRMDQTAHNLQQQTELYGEPLGELVRRVARPARSDPGCAGAGDRAVRADVVPVDERPAGEDRQPGGGLPAPGTRRARTSGDDRRDRSARHPGRARRDPRRHRRVHPFHSARTADPAIRGRSRTQHRPPHRRGCLRGRRHSGPSRPRCRRVFPRVRRHPRVPSYARSRTCSALSPRQRRSSTPRAPSLPTRPPWPNSSSPTAPAAPPTP